MANLQKHSKAVITNKWVKMQFNATAKGSVSVVYQENVGHQRQYE